MSSKSKVQSPKSEGASPKSNVQRPKSAERASLWVKPSNFSTDRDGLLAKLSALNVHKTTAISSLSLWERVRGRGIEFSLAENKPKQPTFSETQGARSASTRERYRLWT
jgi:hypothetical protein